MGILFFRRLSKQRKQELEVIKACTHEYEFLKRVEKEVQYSQGYMDFITVEEVYIYCPKCRNRRNVSPLDWELIQKEQAIDSKYMKKHKIVAV